MHGDAATFSDFLTGTCFIHLTIPLVWMPNLTFEALPRLGPFKSM